MQTSTKEEPEENISILIRRYLETATQDTDRWLTSSLIHPHGKQVFIEAVRSHSIETRKHTVMADLAYE